MGAQKQSSASRRCAHAGRPIGVAFTDSPLGRVLVATTDTGLCAVYLGDDDTALLQALHAEFPAAHIGSGPAPEAAATAIAAYLCDQTPLPVLPLDPVGTPFQRLVWQALCRIPRGETRTYRQLAGELGLPASTARAVGQACAANSLAIVIPCHRAISTAGRLSGFRWGIARKRALLMREGVLLPYLE